MESEPAGDGMGSSRQVVGWLETMTLETSASDRREKEGCVHEVVAQKTTC